MPSKHLFILCHPLLLLLSIFPSIRVFSNKLALCIRWPKYWSFSFNTSPSSEHPGLISFSPGWISLLPRTQESSPIPKFKSINSSALSFLYMTTGKTIAFTRQTFAGKVMSLPFNMLSRLVITSLQGVSVF